MRRQTRTAIGVLMILVGGLWCVQGLGWLGGSDMSGEPLWAFVGGALVVFGVVVAVRAARGEDHPPMWESTSSSEGGSGSEEPRLGSGAPPDLDGR